MLLEAAWISADMAYDISEFLVVILYFFSPYYFRASCLEMHETDAFVSHGYRLIPCRASLNIK